MQKSVSKLRKKHGESNGMTKGIQEINSQDVTENSDQPQFNIQKIDFYAFLASAFSFLAFNICYWITFSAFNFTENFLM